MAQRYLIFEITMLRLIFLILLTSVSASTIAQTRIPNQSTPRNTLEEMFRCARTGDFSQIHLLCNSSIKNDGDTKSVCELNTKKVDKKNEFRLYFKLAYSKDVKFVHKDIAEVSFNFGPKAQKKETMRLIRTKNKWYLASF